MTEDMAVHDHHQSRIHATLQHTDNAEPEVFETLTVDGWQPRFLHTGQVSYKWATPAERKRDIQKVFTTSIQPAMAYEDDSFFMSR